MATNDLYLAVLPLIHLGRTDFGRTEETLTLFPDRNFATEFFPDEVESYLATFKNRIQYLVGGHSQSYDAYTENTDDGRVIVRVTQHVSQ